MTGISATEGRLNWRESVNQVQSVWSQQAQRFTPIAPSQLRETVETSVGQWSSDVQGVLTQPIADWFAAHPLFAWAIDHPLPTLGLLLVVLLLLSGLIQAISSFTTQIWIWLLRSPILLMQGLFAIGLQWAHRPPPAATTQQARLTAILQKLEAMRQEQDKLLQEVRALLSAQDSPRL